MNSRAPLIQNNYRKCLKLTQSTVASSISLQNMDGSRYTRHHTFDDSSQMLFNIAIRLVPHRQTCRPSQKATFYKPCGRSSSGSWEIQRSYSRPLFVFGQQREDGHIMHRRVVTHIIPVLRSSYQCGVLCGHRAGQPLINIYVY